MLNHIYNGHFALTGRGSWVLYGNTARRVIPRSVPQLLSGVLYATDLEVCQKFFKKEDCRHWTYELSDRLSSDKYNELAMQGLPEDAINHRLNALSFKAIFQNPLQYIFLYAVEALKMLFWEGTNVGFVIYPAWLQSIYANAAVHFLLDLILGLASGASLIYAIRYVFKNRKAVSAGEGHATLLFSLLLIVIPYILLHAFFLILKRYAVVLCPLYLVLIGWMVSKTKNWGK